MSLVGRRQYWGKSSWLRGSLITCSLALAALLPLQPAHSGGQLRIGSCVSLPPALREVSGILRDGASWEGCGVHFFYCMDGEGLTKLAYLSPSPQKLLKATALGFLLGDSDSHWLCPILCSVSFKGIYYAQTIDNDTVSGCCGGNENELDMIFVTQGAQNLAATNDNAWYILSSLFKVPRTVSRAQYLA